MKLNIKSYNTGDLVYAHYEDKYGEATIFGYVFQMNMSKITIVGVTEMIKSGSKKIEQITFSTYEPIEEIYEIKEVTEEDLLKEIDTEELIKNFRVYYVYPE